MIIEKWTFIINIAYFYNQNQQHLLLQRHHSLTSINFKSTAKHQSFDKTISVSKSQTQEKIIDSEIKRLQFRIKKRIAFGSDREMNRRDVAQNQDKEEKTEQKIERQINCKLMQNQFYDIEPEEQKKGNIKYDNPLPAQQISRQPPHIKEQEAINNGNGAFAAEVQPNLFGEQQKINYDNSKAASLVDQQEGACEGMLQQEQDQEEDSQEGDLIEWYSNMTMAINSGSVDSLLHQNRGHFFNANIGLLQANCSDNNRPFLIIEKQFNEHSESIENVRNVLKDQGLEVKSIQNDCRLNGKQQQPISNNQEDQYPYPSSHDNPVLKNNPNDEHRSIDFDQVLQAIAEVSPHAFNAQYQCKTKNRYWLAVDTCEVKFIQINQDAENKSGMGDRQNKGQASADQTGRNGREQNQDSNLQFINPECKCARRPNAIQQSKQQEQDENKPFGQQQQPSSLPREPPPVCECCFSQQEKFVRGEDASNFVSKQYCAKICINSCKIFNQGTLIAKQGQQNEENQKDCHEKSIANEQQQAEIEILFSDIGDYENFKNFLMPICFIVAPSLDSELEFIQNIGTGSQATVDLYKERLSAELMQQLKLGKKAFPEMSEEEYKVIRKQQLMMYHQREQYAVKRYKIRADRADIDFKQVLNEIKYLRDLKICTNIVQLNQVFVTPVPPPPANAQQDEIIVKQIELVMKFAQYGTILKHLQKKQKFNEEEIRTIMVQLILAVDLMHQKGIIHRDLKPDNILILDKSEIQVCISDLGLACSASDKKEVLVKCGTPGYVAPEIFKGKPFSNKSDIFGLGCCFYNILTNQNLYPGRNGKEILYSNKTQNPYSIVQTKVNNVSPECKQLLLRMLSMNPEQRPTAEQCIQHQWFSKDRKALQGSLFLNKNSQLLANLFNQPQFLDINKINDCASFVFAPNYFEMIQVLSSKKGGGIGSSLLRFSQNNYASGVPSGTLNQNNYSSGSPQNIIGGVPLQGSSQPNSGSSKYVQISPLNFSKQQQIVWNNPNAINRTRQQSDSPNIRGEGGSSSGCAAGQVCTAANVGGLLNQNHQPLHHHNDSYNIRSSEISPLTFNHNSESSHAINYAGGLANNNRGCIYPPNVPHQLTPVGGPQQNQGFDSLDPNIPNASGGYPNNPSESGGVAAEEQLPSRIRVSRLGKSSIANSSVNNHLSNTEGRISSGSQQPPRVINVLNANGGIFKAIQDQIDSSPYSAKNASRSPMLKSKQFLRNQVPFGIAAIQSRSLVGSIHSQVNAAVSRSGSRRGGGGQTAKRQYNNSSQSSMKINYNQIIAKGRQLLINSREFSQKQYIGALNRDSGSHQDVNKNLPQNLVASMKDPQNRALNLGCGPEGPLAPSIPMMGGHQQQRDDSISKPPHKNLSNGYQVQVGHYLLGGNVPSNERKYHQIERIKNKHQSSDTPVIPYRKKSKSVDKLCQYAGGAYDQGFPISNVIARQAALAKGRDDDQQSFRRVIEQNHPRNSNEADDQHKYGAYDKPKINLPKAFNFQKEDKIESLDEQRCPQSKLENFGQDQNINQTQYYRAILQIDGKDPSQQQHLNHRNLPLMPVPPSAMTNNNNQYGSAEGENNRGRGKISRINVEEVKVGLSNQVNDLCNMKQRDHHSKQDDFLQSILNQDSAALQKKRGALLKGGRAVMLALPNIQADQDDPEYEQLWTIANSEAERGDLSHSSSSSESGKELDEPHYDNDDQMVDIGDECKFEPQVMPLKENFIKKHSQGNHHKQTNGQHLAGIEAGAAVGEQQMQVTHLAQELRPVAVAALANMEFLSSKDQFNRAYLCAMDGGGGVSPAFHSAFVSQHAIDIVSRKNIGDHMERKKKGRSLLRHKNSIATKRLLLLQ